MGPAGNDLLESQDKEGTSLNYLGGLKSNNFNTQSRSNQNQNSKSKFMARSNSAKNARNIRINENDLTLSMINNNNNMRESSPIRNDRKNDRNHIKQSPQESQTLRDK